MPLYDYKCENGHVFEVMHGFDDDGPTKCKICEAPVERVLHPVAVHFKGSGFYSTDYGAKKKVASEGSTSSDSKDGPSGSDSGSASDSSSSSGSASSSEGSGSKKDSSAAKSNGAGSD